MASTSGTCDWQLRCTELKQRGAHLLQTGQWSDCSFLVGSEPHQVVVPAHKLILAMASPVFEAMFYGSMAEGNEPIPLVDVQPEAFKALLEYIYTDNINISSFDKACQLCYGAKKYMLPLLVKKCTEYLLSAVNPKNACRAYEFARLLEENVLMEKCLQIISTNTKEVLTDSSFEDIDLNTMITVFSLEHLIVNSELDLFEAAVRYAKAQDKRQAERAPSPGPGSPKPVKPPATSNETVVNVVSSPEAGDAEPCRAEPGPGASGADAYPESHEKAEKLTIRSAIEKIRFLTLSPQQFAEGPARSPLLAESEAFAVLMHISTSNSHVPLPRGFSACRERRGATDSFTDFINQEFKRRNITHTSQFRCSCKVKVNLLDYATHLLQDCHFFTAERLDFEDVCELYMVEPYSEDIKKHEDIYEALKVFLDQIKARLNAQSKTLELETLPIFHKKLQSSYRKK